jgi:hypothetical protein
LVNEFLELTSEAQREVRDFVRFKKLQQLPEKSDSAAAAPNEEERP